MIEHLYIHVPFCAAKCRYCGFYSVVGDEETHRRFAPLPGRELALRSPEPLRPLTLYMGGGTPGILEPEAFSALVRSLGQHCRFDALEEWTAELNPASVTPERIRTLRHVGVKRVSVGVQCLDDGILRTMGRTHDAECAVKALKLLRQGGFTSLGVDLIA